MIFGKDFCCIVPTLYSRFKTSAGIHPTSPIKYISEKCKIDLILLSGSIWIYNIHVVHH
nr:hypothetical protein [Rickettsia conorii]